MAPRQLEKLRMLADWQLRELGHDPKEITRLCREKDDRDEAASTAALIHRLNETD